jgi:hypothetical protein
MKLLGLSGFVVLGAAVLATACSSSSGGGGTPDSGGGGGAPTISLTTSGSVTVVTNGSEKDVPLAFTTSNFTLKQPGQCGSLAGGNTCGHVHVFVDYTASSGSTPCGEPGAPYNNQGWTSPVNANMSQCTTDTPSFTINGSHSFRLELHNDGHGPINDASGNVIQSTATLTVSGG